MTHPDDYHKAWMVSLMNAVADFEDTGDYPRGFDAGWLQRQRSADRRGLPWMTPERQTLLDQWLPGWRDSARPAGRPWEDTAPRVAAFHAVHGRYPRQGIAGEEGRLGQWLSNQRTASRKPRYPTENRQWLDEHLPGWNTRGGRTDAWEQTASELRAWRRKNKREPSRRSTDPEERRLGYWAKNRKADAKAGKLSAKQVRALDAT